MAMDAISQPSGVAVNFPKYNNNHMRGPRSQIQSDGGNCLFGDGEVKWIPAEDMTQTPTQMGMLMPSKPGVYALIQYLSADKLMMLRPDGTHTVLRKDTERIFW